MCMNIYITKENQDFLRNLSDQSMSGLVNDLLNDYKEKVTEESVPEEGSSEPLGSSVIDIPTKPGLKYCKNGHALDKYGKCFGPGCKYAKA